jgi:hypothetical protein
MERTSHPRFPVAKRMMCKKRVSTGELLLYRRCPAQLEGGRTGGATPLPSEQTTFQPAKNIFCLCANYFIEQCGALSAKVDSRQENPEMHRFIIRNERPSFSSERLIGRWCCPCSTRKSVHKATLIKKGPGRLRAARSAAHPGRGRAPQPERVEQVRGRKTGLGEAVFAHGQEGAEVLLRIQGQDLQP